MRGGRRRAAAGAAATLAALALPAVVAAAPPPRSEASFGTPGLFPGYRPGVHDYVVRCHDAPVPVDAHASPPWRVAIGGRAFGDGDVSRAVPLSTGRAFTVTFRTAAGSRLYRYHVRCLPSNFPTYSFTRNAPVSPAFFTADDAFSKAQNRYAIIFDRNGVPLWWYPASAEGPRVFPSGHVLWFDTGLPGRGRWEVHRLDGSLVRVLPAAGSMPMDGHDLQLLPNGDYLLGGRVRQTHVDTSAYGGSGDADVLNARLQEVSPAGGLAWEWQSQDHVSLGETGRWWPYAVKHSPATGNAYDLVHWNSIEPDGRSVIASFRTLDAVYKIIKATGRIAWKLGGTRTPRSLTVEGDPDAPTLAGQHDARLLPDGTLTVFDNRTSLTGPIPDPQPRAVRYRIDPGTRTATLVESIRDPAVTRSYCCGSARRLPDGDWLIDWAQGSGAIGGYEPDGTRTFLLRFDSTFSYRAQPVPAGALSIGDLRQGMNARCASGCG
jgi:hypothetical protein